MVRLDFSPEEMDILSDVLTGDLSDLRMEIAHTDRLDYRRGLKVRKKVLIKALDALQHPGERTAVRP